MIRRGVSNINVKSVNQDAVYWYIYNNNNVSTKDIMNGLGLSLPTVSQNLKLLAGRRLITSKSVMDSTGGRKARAYRPDENSYFTLGLDITSRRINSVIVDLVGNIVSHENYRIAFRNEPAYYKNVGEIALRSVKALGISDEYMLGIGVALPAIISDSGVCTANALGETSIEKESFEDNLPYEFTLYNDASAGGYAEFWAREPSHDHSNRCIAYLSVSDTVGGCVMIEGNLYHGVNRHSAEFGHLTLVPNGKPCYCGQKGCAYAYLNTGRLADLAEGSLDLFFERLASGDPVYKKYWDDYMYYLALAIGDIRAAFDCDLIIGGYLGRHIEPYMDELRRRAAKRNMFEQTGDFVLPCAHVCEASAMGAALMRQYDGVMRVLRRPSCEAISVEALP